MKMTSHSIKAAILKCFIVLGFLSFGKLAIADLVITVGNGDGQTTPVQVSQNSIGFIDFVVSASDDSPANSDSFRLSGYNISVDFGGDDFGTPSEFSNFAAIPVAGPEGSFDDDGAVNLDSATPEDLAFLGLEPDYDFVVGDTNSSGPNIVEGADPLGLFRLTFDIGNAPVGIYDVLFRVETSGSNINSTSFTTDPAGQTVVAQQGSIQITSAIPEPNTVAVGLLAGVAFVARRRRR